MKNEQASLGENSQISRLPTLLKFIYGTGDWGRASFNTLRQFFYAIFLTDVVGLDPRLASVAALVGIIWDAFNDPIIGSLSDNVQTRWGRRRPFLLLFSVPFLLAFLLLWWAPPWQSEIVLAIHVTLAFMVSDTIQTLVTVPYLALTPELAVDYDDRTSLTSIRMFFNLLASLVTAVAAPSIMDAVIYSGYSLQQAYLIIAALFGGLATVPYLVIFFVIREQDVLEPILPQQITMRQTLKVLSKNTPFKYATGMYVLNWISFDLVASMIPFFLLYWMAGGNLLAKVDVFGEPVALASVTLGILLITATVTIPFWNWLAQKFSKRTAYISGMLFWIVVQMLIFSLQPGQLGYMLFLAFLAGIGVSSAHIMPDAIFPDVIDWDEFRTHMRREGMYYGAINFLRKLSGAFAIFLILQVLGWIGYQAPDHTATVFSQPERVLLAIRILTGPVAVVLLIAAVIFIWFYPLTRERQTRIRTLLQRRKNKILGEKAHRRKKIQPS